MDNWNRNNENEYTGVTAQRRNRRRAGAETGNPEPAVPAEAEVSAEFAVPAEPEKPAVTEPETSAESLAENPAVETPAKEEAPAEPVVQGADSRVPPEARRMAAAPYGVLPEGAKRPGTRPQVAQRRPAAPEGHRPAPGAQRKTGSPEALRSGAGRQGKQPPRVNVGYAPGRMSDDATRQIPVADAVRDSYQGRDAKAYLEKRKQPFRMEENQKPMQDRSGHKVLRAVVLLLVLAGAVLTGKLLLKNRENKTPQPGREAPQVISFDPSHAEGIAPVQLIFLAETDKSVEEIRLHADGDRDPEMTVKCGDNADSKVWSAMMPVETGFTGTLMLQVRRIGEEEWIDTGRTCEVNVSTPIGADVPQVAQATTDPEDDDYYDPDAEATEGGNAGQQAPEATPAPTDAPEEQPAAQMTEPPEEDPEDREPAVLLTPPPTPTPAPTEEVEATVPPLEAEAAPEANPDLIVQTTVYTSMTKKEKDYNRAAKELIHMPVADEYTKQKLGVMTFRGDNFRRNAAAGTLSAEPLKLSVLWQTEGGSARGENQTYYGYQWTGQPVIARWSTEVRTKSNITEKKIDKSSLKEVIIAGMDGWIRFLDLEDGKITRNSIKLGYAMRGTPSLHPRGFPFMSVGQYARKMKNKRGQIGLRQYNLYSQKELKLIDGLDGKYHRPLNDIGSFETSALIDRESDTLIAVGTNGMLYLESLGLNFDYNLGVMTVSPSVVAMNSLAKGQSRGKGKSAPLAAVESSPAAYDKYVFYADMGGVLRCVDTNKLAPVWAVDTGDSVMAAIAMDMTGKDETRQLNLYTANMLNNRKRGNGNVQIRRYDAMSGREIWCTDIGVFKSKKDKGRDNVGAKASPVIGQNGLQDYVYFTVTGLSDEGTEKLGLKSDTPAALIALNKADGRVAWAFGLDSRSESSPVALYDNDGKGWIVQCEQAGVIHLVDGLTGREVTSLQIEGEIEASPAAYNNVVVIGTTGKGKAFIYGIEVKLDKAQESSSAVTEAPKAEETAAPAPADEKPEEPEDPDIPEEIDGAEDADEYDDFEDYEEYDPEDEESGDGRQ